MATAEAARGVRGRGGQPTRQSQGVRLCVGMLKGALLAAHLGLLTAVGIGLAYSGSTGAANAAVAGALVVVFFASGQAVQLVASELADGTGLAVLMASYLLRAVGLGLVLWLAMSSDRLEVVFDRGMFFCGAMLTLVGWIAGILVTHSRQHVFAYDRDADRAMGGSR